MTMRSVQDRFWADGWVRQLNPLDRYLFLYLITNEHTTWCGIYELPLSTMAFESGIDERDLGKTMLTRLEPKIIYVNEWVYIPNWVRHHSSESGNLSPQQQKGIEEAWRRIPAHTQDKIVKKVDELNEKDTLSIPYPYPIHRVSASSLSSPLSNNAFSNENASSKENTLDDDETTTEETDDEGNPIVNKWGHSKTSKKPPRNNVAYRVVLAYEIGAQKHTGNKRVAYGKGTGGLKRVGQLLTKFSEKELIDFCNRYIGSAKFEQNPSILAALSDDSLHKYESGIL